MDNNFTILTVSMIFQHFYFRSYIQTITVICINHDSQACRISAKKLTYQLSSTLNVHIDTSHSRTLQFYVLGNSDEKTHEM